MIWDYLWPLSSSTARTAPLCRWFRSVFYQMSIFYVSWTIILSLSSSSKHSSVGVHVIQHPGHQASHVVPLKSLSVGDPLAFLQRVNRHSEKTDVKFVVHRYGNSLDDKELSLLQNNEPSMSFLETLNADLHATVIPMFELRNSHFVGPVQIGTPPQTLYLVFDTGSTNVQVVGTGCTDKSCNKVSKFDPFKSSTFESISPAIRLDITFGTGRIHSQLATDSVALGPYIVHNQTVGVIDREGATRGKPNVFDRIDFQGIVGFGFPSLASAGRMPFFDNLMAHGDKKANEFAIYMGQPNKVKGGADPSNISSAFFIGGVDSRFYDGHIRMVPVIREHYWEVGLSSFWIGDKKFCCEEGSKNYVIIDSGTSFNTLPYRDISKFRQLVPKRPCHEDMEDVLQTFPMLTYKLAGGVDVILTPDMYVIQTKEHQCEPAYMQIDVLPEFGHAYILGSLPYMRHYFTVFHRGLDEPSMIGIARAKHSDEGTSFLQSLQEESMQE